MSDMHTYRFSRRKDKTIVLTVTTHGEAAVRSAMSAPHGQRGVRYRPVGGDWQAKHTWAGDQIADGLKHLRSLDSTLAERVKKRYEQLQNQVPAAAVEGLSAEDIRSAVKASLKRDLQQEMGLCAQQTRANLAAVEKDTLSLWKIQGDYSSLDRLPAQEKIYSGVADEVTLVTTTRHLQTALAVIPAWWGIVIATGIPENIHLHSLRPGMENPTLDPHLLASLLWADEARSVLQRYGLGRGTSRMNRGKLWDALATSLGIEVLRHEVRDAMASRTSWG